ncbi:DEAD/DEAH box helicase [Bacteroides sp. 519]|uniref:DEAD/DEAH box helicase n=1 Tax=Bacteroides sp. 519 TaxID=2302937 RepID=UPI0013D8B534|nr:DEAD/DEAH box helicase [Bacteroides sp. 519]NDV57418.1 ATP-dependent helicase [Bacteroides sp. 519]
MKDISPQTKIVIVLVQHPVFGPLLIPYTAQDMPDGTVQLLEQAFHLSAELKQQLNEVAKTAIEIASRYSEKHLMTVYSREKNVNTFLKKLTEETLKKTIRPFIEKKLAEMVDLIRNHNLPLYQNSPGNKILYPHSAYKISSNLTESSFYFEADEECFRYKLNCKRGGEEVSLLDKKPVTTIVFSPAIILAGNEMHVFHDIQASRILPFTNKPVVSVSVAQLDKYIENIVYPIMCHHEVESKGLPIIEEHRECEAIISVESSIYGATLQLVFAYGNKHFYPGKKFTPKYTFLCDEDGRKVIRYFYRDRQKEEIIANKLKNNGLQLLNDSFYKLSEETPFRDITEWISNNKNLFGDDIRLMNIDKGANYCLDEATIEQSVTETNDWFELHITVVIGNYHIPFIRFRKNILQGNREYTLPDGKIVLLPEEWFREYTDMLELSEEDTSAIKLKRSYVGVIQNIFKKDQRKKTGYQEKEKVNPPKELKTQLRRYQEEGFNWMLHLNRNRLGGCLADDMGLGKTIQTLTVLQHVYSGQNIPDFRSSEPGQLSLFGNNELVSRLNASLIVVPTSLIHNWRREAAKFTKLTVYEYTGSNQLKGTSMEQLFNRSNLILTSYGIMRNNIEELAKYSFEYIVLDESQNIKNSDSQTFKAAIRLRGNHKLVLTGTPIENSLKDLWSQFHFIQPDLFGSESDYNKQYINPIKQNNQQVENKLQKLISPFILRRSKQEVAPELPSLTEEVIYCDMTEQQNEIYQKEKNGLRNLLLQQQTEKVNHNNLIVLNGIMQLRQLASHPRMVQQDFTGSSGKLEEIITMYATLHSEGHKVLIFSSFVKHLEIIAEAFNKQGWKYAILTGATSNREQEISRFINNNDIGAFFISLKAGGVGLNLTQADYVFIIDPWWNPASEMQAISRAHRIGQDKNVFAYRFITQNSIEEKIIRLQEGKRKLSETFIVDSNPFDTLTDKEWMELL